MTVQQGDIFDVEGSLWIVVDNFHNRVDTHKSVHCAPVLDNADLRLDLDVPIAFQGGFISLSPLKKVNKASLTQRLGTAHPSELEQIRHNLVTRFSYYTFIDLDDVSLAPSPPDQPPSIYPGMIFHLKEKIVCVVDHWGCFNDYSLLYLAPVGAKVADQSPLDVDISSQFRDLFTDKYFVRVDDLFLLDKDRLEATYSRRPQMLNYGLVRKISRAMALKFGQLGLLL